ncbi:hypothetical protein FRC06_011384 [Ceratobasidium sp. 370]|nr:hypothetical protein FRC06_011384 [Ceratobasidium sp. 370]
MIYKDPVAFTSRTYDYVIIGGGVVGLVIATRLSEDPNVHVAVLEAGDYVVDDDRVKIPAYFGRTLGDPEFDWMLKTVPQASVDGRRIPLPRGKTLGGTSIINSMTWFRGTREDYDALQELGNPGWGWRDWIPYFRKSETLHPPHNDTWALENAATFEPDLSGTKGPLQRSFVPWLGDTHIPFLKSLEKLGLRANLRANAGHNIGVFTVTATVDPKTSQRSCVTTAYFEPNASRRNLHVLLRAHADRVLLRQSTANLYEARGVEFLRSSTRYQVFASREVIVSAGAHLSPGVLERSGIGCHKRLQALGVTPLVDLPGVGENLQDHLLVPSSFELKDDTAITGDLVRNAEFAARELERYKRDGGGMYASIHSAFSMLSLESFVPPGLVNKAVSLVEEFLNCASSPGLRKLLEIQQRWFKDPNRGQLEIMHVPEFCTFDASQPKGDGRYVSLLSVIMQPLSRGSVHILSPDPLQLPAVDPRYYSNRIDLELMVQGLKYVQRLANTEPLSSFISKPVEPKPDQLDEASLERYARKMLESAHHPVGTTSMLPREDGGVVDSELKAIYMLTLESSQVYGVRNLRVADAGVFPLSMSSHPQATLYALGEKILAWGADPGVLWPLSHSCVKMFEPLPLVAVVGSTGVGKSRLAVELASSVRDRLLRTSAPWANSKIINADAMQTYEGLDLVTNKITPSEMNGIEHTLFDFRDLQEDYVVTEWVTDAISEINSAHETQKLPVVVGGTSYWLQHLLFANRLTSLTVDGPVTPSRPQPTTFTIPELAPSLQQLFDNLPARADDVDEDTSFQLHALLTHLDPTTASRWHWKDTRKVLRSINIIRESNMTVGEAYKAQLDPVSRYPTLIFWLYMDPSVLNPMLDSRIDKMVESGLREEIEQMRQAASAADGKIEMVGLNQAIGYKEFKGYFEDPSRPQLEFDRGVERMKVATRQYATRQVKWIKSRLLPTVLASENVHIVLLEVKDPAHWDEDVLRPALRYLSEFLDGQISAAADMHCGILQSFIQQADALSATSNKRKIRCDICTVDPQKPVMLNEGIEWDAHKKSRSHRRKSSRDTRKEEQLRQQGEVQAQRASVRAGILSSAEE